MTNERLLEGATFRLLEGGTSRIMEGAHTPPGGFEDFSNLIAYYKFNETSGDLLNLCSLTGSTDCVTGFDGSPVGVIYGLEGIKGEAFGFDGIDDEIDHGDLPIDGLANVTINMWAYSPDLTPNGHSSQYWSKGELEGSSFEFYLFVDGRVVVQNGSNSLIRTAPIGSIPAINTWYMATVRFDGTLPQVDRMKIYINASRVDNLGAGTNKTTTASSPGDPFRLGELGRIVGQNFTGRMDEISIWTRTLTEAELTQLYNSGSGLELTPPPPAVIGTILDGKGPLKIILNDKSRIRSIHGGKDYVKTILNKRGIVS